MSIKALGPHFDIHGGGFDLQFPHHENEIAQSEACTGQHFVNYWMHNGFVRVNEEKMSKSLGNFFTLREVFSRYRPEVVRYFILASHYRSPLNYSDEQLDAAHAAMSRLYTALRGIELPGRELPEKDTDYEQRFIAAMDDDFNTPVAIAVLFDLAHEINKCRVSQPKHAEKMAALMKRLGGILGFLQTPPETYLQGMDGGIKDEDIAALINARQAARGMRDFARADAIRDHLLEVGVVLEDGPSGTTWRRASGRS
jgi:cysteinyl-tRNA synthetase